MEDRKKVPSDFACAKETKTIGPPDPDSQERYLRTEEGTESPVVACAV